MSGGWLVGLFALYLCTGILCFFLGKKHQHKYDLDDYMVRLKDLEFREQQAQARIAEELKRLEMSKLSFKNLDWKSKIKELKK